MWFDTILVSVGYEMCIYCFSFYVVINGEPSDVFVPERGLKQGDPISP